VGTFESGLDAAPQSDELREALRNARLELERERKDKLKEAKVSGSYLK